MKDASSQLKDVLIVSESVQVLAISDSLRSRADFLLSFTPSGKLQRDMESVLRGTGEHGVLTIFRRYDLSMRDLAASIRHNHEDELENLRRGGHPLWSPKSEHWSPEQLEFCRRILALEIEVFDSILDNDRGSSEAA